MLALASTVWVTNVSFFVYGKRLASRQQGTLLKCRLISGVVRVNNRRDSDRCESAGLSHSQIRADWSPEQDSCTMLNIESTKLGVTVALVTDVVLFLIMLYGLLRLGIHGGGTFILGRFLWKQVW